MKNYSILFVVGVWGIGGVERVTAFLASAFLAKGWRVAIVAVRFDDRSLLDGLSADIEVCELSERWFSRENCLHLNTLIKRRQVDFIINQWCLPYIVTNFLKRAIKGTSAKLIAVHHNEPDKNKRIIDARNVFSRFFWRFVTRLNLRLVYEFSDAYVVLSCSFIEVLKKLICIGSRDKVVAITNPLTLTVAQEKEKEDVILYVGRLEESQKRITRVLEVWKQICNKLPNWRLEIVGDGPDRAEYEEMARDLPRIVFHGYQVPAEYYAKSKILLMTSDFEGFPLVLIEAMAHGCASVVLNSYPSVKDISNGGMRLVSDPFNVRIFSEEVLAVATDRKMWMEMSVMAKTITDQFGVEAVVEQWKSLFGKLKV